MQGVWQIFLANMSGGAEYVCDRGTPRTADCLKNRPPSPTSPPPRNAGRDLPSIQRGHRAPNPTSSCNSSQPPKPTSPAAGGGGAGWALARLHRSRFAQGNRVPPLPERFARPGAGHALSRGRCLSCRPRSTAADLDSIRYCTNIQKWISDPGRRARGTANERESHAPQRPTLPPTPDRGHVRPRSSHNSRSVTHGHCGDLPGRSWPGGLRKR
jgi:hypothetical protein